MSELVLFKEAGWYVTVTSWENDADNYKTESMKFRTQDQALFVVDLLKNFGSSGSGFDEKHLGNAQFFRNGVYEKYQNAVKAYIQQLSMRYDVPECYSEFEYVDECIIYDLVGFWGDGEMLRVVEKISLDYLPNDIYIENILMVGV